MGAKKYWMDLDGLMEAVTTYDLRYCTSSLRRQTGGAGA